MLNNNLFTTWPLPKSFFGSGSVNETSHVTHPFVHAVEQPVANASYETKTTHKGLHPVTNQLFGVAALIGGGWLAWTLMGEIMPSERRNIQYALSGIGKRLRIT